MQNIRPILLCGGSGTRLWPLSRKSYPKQFSLMNGDKSLFQGSAERLSGMHDGVSFLAPTILTNSDFRFIVTEQLAACGIDPGDVLIEPEGRNTAPAILAAALHHHARDPEALLLIAPSDHVVPDKTVFLQAVAAGVSAAQNGQLVTFGITPTQAETAYGYLELDTAPDGSGAPQPLKRFVEKPDAETAGKMVAAGNFLWNAGIFLMRADAIIAAFEVHAPTLCEPVRAALKNAETDLGFLRLDGAAWAQADNISVDYAVMEHAENLSVVPFHAAWSDLGGWDAVWRESAPDADGVVAGDGATALDCRNVLLRSESAEQAVVGIGLENIIAVAMPDAVLVADMSRAQDVKQVVTALVAQNAPQAEQFPKDHRPWGWFESLVAGDRFQVKRIVVQPGAALSLQSHVHRAEHWVVVEGTARVTVGDTVSLLTENESVYVPLGAVHRLENPGKVPMVLIEVQTGAYIGEDDIVRYEDVYARETEITPA